MSTRKEHLVNEIVAKLLRVRDIGSPALKRRCLLDVVKLAAVFRVEATRTSAPAKRSRLIKDADGLDQLVAELENEGW